VSEPRTWVVFWRKRVHMASRRSFRKYVAARGGYTENWKLALRFQDEALARLYAQRIDADEVEVVEETRPLPAPKVSLWLKQGAEP